MIFRETRHHAQAYVTSGALIHCALSLTVRRTQTVAQLGWQFHWPAFVMATSAEVSCCCYFSSSSSSSKYSLTLLASVPDSESVSSTRISLMASSSSFIFLALARYPQLSALFRLPCMTGHSCRNVIPVKYELLLQWQQNRSKATMWLLYKIPATPGCPRRCY